VLHRNPTTTPGHPATRKQRTPRATAGKTSNLCNHLSSGTDAKSATLTRSVASCCRAKILAKVAVHETLVNRRMHVLRRIRMQMVMSVFGGPP